MGMERGKMMIWTGAMALDLSQAASEDSFFLVGPLLFQPVDLQGPGITEDK